MLLRVLHGSAAADSSSRKGSRGADGSNTQQPQSAGSSSSRANGSCKGVWRGFLRRQSAARSPRSTSSTAMSGAAAGSDPPMSRTPVSRPQLDGTSASTDAKAAEAEDGRGACCLKSCNGSSGSSSSSSGSACAVVPLFGEVERLRSDGLLLRSGGAVGADVLLYCTGYNRSYEFINEGLRARLGLQKDGLPLFRHMLPPQLPGLAFVGCEAGSFNTPLTAGLQAEWLAAVVARQVALPSQQAMQEDVRKMTAWSRRVFPPHRHRASAVQLFMLQYHEQLLRDMQLAPPRHGWLLQALTAQDYRFVFTLPLEGGARPPARQGLGGRSRPGRRLAGPAGAAAAEARRESAAEASSSCAGSAEEGEGHPLGAASVAAAAAQALQATARFAAVQPASAAAAVDAASSGGVLCPRQQQPEAAQQQQQCWASMSEQDATVRGVQPAVALSHAGSSGSRTAQLLLGDGRGSTCAQERQCGVPGSPAVAQLSLASPLSCVQQQQQHQHWDAAEGAAAGRPLQQHTQLGRSDSLGTSTPLQASGAAWRSSSALVGPPVSAAAVRIAEDASGPAADDARHCKPAVAAPCDAHGPSAQVSPMTVGRSSAQRSSSSSCSGASAAGGGSADKLLAPAVPQQAARQRRAPSMACSSADSASLHGSSLLTPPQHRQRAAAAAAAAAAPAAAAAWLVSGPPTPTALGSLAGMQVGGLSVRSVAALDAGSLAAAAAADGAGLSSAVSTVTTGTSKCGAQAAQLPAAQLRQHRSSSCSCSNLAPAVPAAAARALRRRHCSSKEAAAAGRFLQSSVSSRGATGSSAAAAADGVPVHGSSDLGTCALGHEQQQAVDDSSSDLNAAVEDGPLPAAGERAQHRRQQGQSKQSQAVLRWLESLPACSEDAAAVGNPDFFELQQQGCMQHHSSHSRGCANKSWEHQLAAAAPASSISCFAAAAAAAECGASCGGSSSSRGVSSGCSPRQLLPLVGVSGGGDAAAPRRRHSLSNRAPAAQQQQQQVSCSCTPGQLEAALAEWQQQQQGSRTLSANPPADDSGAARMAAAAGAVGCSRSPLPCFPSLAADAACGGSAGPPSTIAGTPTSNTRRSSTVSPLDVPSCTSSVQQPPPPPQQQHQQFGCQGQDVNGTAGAGAAATAAASGLLGGCPMPPLSEAAPAAFGAVLSLAAAPDAAAAAETSAKWGLRSLARHLSLPVGGRLPPAAAAAAVQSTSGSVCSRARSANLQGLQGVAAPPPAAAAAAEVRSSSGGMQSRFLQQQQPAEAAARLPRAGFGHYEYYAQHQHLHEHTRRHMHGQPHEQHPLASLKQMLQQMRQAADAADQQQQQAALMADLQERQQAAAAGVGSAVTAAAGALVHSLGSAAAAAAAAAPAAEAHQAAALRGAAYNSSGSGQARVQLQAETQTDQRHSVRGVTAAAARQAAASGQTCHRPRDRQQQPCSAHASASSPASHPLPQRLTAALLAEAAAAAGAHPAGVDCFATASSCAPPPPPQQQQQQQRPGSGRSRRLSGQRLPGRLSQAAAAAPPAAAVAGAAALLQDTNTGYDTSSGQQLRVRVGRAPGSGCAGPAAVPREHAKQPSLRGGTTGASSRAVHARLPADLGLGAAGGAGADGAGWADVRTHDWLQRQQLLQGQQQQRRHVQVQPQPQAPAAAAAAPGSRSATSGSSGGLVLERLGSKQAALRQLHLLQRDPASAKQLVQSLKAWQASPQAAAAAKLAARSSSTRIQGGGFAQQQ
ncbi:hypothetical protein COO60DRAFT_1705923 [Scenedesmus sp. NREL 46B-D3]|nr:hypothetical protein COO60DRAFT_1705923 [Scenedesmus sp. NREL 46B-D3]